MTKRKNVQQATKFLAATALITTAVAPTVQAEEVTVSTIADARALELNQAVTVEGVVTTAPGFAGSNKSFYIQDATGGIFVYVKETDVKIGDKVRITGSLAAYKGELQLSNPTIEQLPSTGEQVTPAEETVTADNQGELITLKGVKISGLTKLNDEGTFEFVAKKDGQADVAVKLDNRSGYKYDQFVAAGFNSGDIVDVTGVAGNPDGTFLLKAIGEAAFTLVEDGVEEAVEIPTTDVATARAATVGNIVKFQGVITSKPGFNGAGSFYVQDDTAGIFLYSPGSGFSVGQEVIVEGKRDAYNGEVQIRPTSVEIVGTKELPAVQTVTAEAIDDSYLGELVQLEQVTVSEVTTDSYDNFTMNLLTTDNKKVVVYNDSRGGLTGTAFKEAFKEGDVVNVTGIVGNNNGTYRVQVWDLAQFEGELAASKGSGAVKEGTTLDLTTIYDDAKIYYTTDGSTPTEDSPVYTSPIEITQSMTVKALIVFGGKSVEKEFVYTIAPFYDDKKIGDIQGAAHTSPVKDAIVRVSGTVTRTTSDSFVIQDAGDDNAATSDAIFVKAAGHSYKAGDVVTVEGQVVEQGGGTDLTTTTIVAEEHEKTGTATLPTALYIGQDVVAPKTVIDNDNLTVFEPQDDAIDFYESLEGMRVAVKDAKIVAPQSGGTTVVVPNIEGLTFNNLGGLSIAKDNFNPSRIFVDKGNNTATSGDSFEGDIVGVMGYDSSNFKLFTTEALPELVTNAHKDDVTHIKVDENKLTVATYNIENFSAATPVDKTKGLAKQIVNNLKTPDVIALTEVQDNDGATDSGNTDASKSYEALIAEIKELTNIEYKWADVAPENNQDGGAPGGNIRPGFLYNPERVTLQEAPKGSATEGTAWTADGELTLNPGRVMEHKQENTRKALAAQFTFNKTGEAFTVIGAHLNSKSGDEPLFGKTQPATLVSEAERVELAAAIQSFVKKGLEKNPNANIFVAGDMNDFQFSAPLEALKGDTLTNMIDVVEAADRFTYSFEGNNQVLDHILVTNSLATTAKVDVVHVNANVQEKDGSVSDHDPVLVQVELVKAEEPVEETPEVTPAPSPTPTPNPAPPTTTPEVEQPVEETPETPEEEQPVEETPEVPEEETLDVEEQPEEETPPVEEPEETPEEQPAVVAPFTDVADSYSKEAINALYAAGITTGTTETTFSPTAPMTRAQFAVMIARALNVKATKATPFTDVQGKWYADAVGALYEAGIVTGKTETTFEPGATITRQQAAALIVRLMEKQNYTFTNTAALSYNDAANISPYAQDAAAKLLAENIMTGDNNNFMPQQPLTRQQMAKILYTALVKVNVLN